MEILGFLIGSSLDFLVLALIVNWVRRWYKRTTKEQAELYERRSKIDPKSYFESLGEPK